MECVGSAAHIRNLCHPHAFHNVGTTVLQYQVDTLCVDIPFLEHGLKDLADVIPLWDPDMAFTLSISWILFQF